MHNEKQSSLRCVVGVAGKEYAFESEDGKSKFSQLFVRLGVAS